MKDVMEDIWILPQAEAKWQMPPLQKKYCIIGYCSE